jgi:hypothetical protein
VGASEADLWPDAGGPLTARTRPDELESFAVSRGWRGLRFEAWRDSTADGLYAVITDDPSELWHELEMAQR